MNLFQDLGLISSACTFACAFGRFFVMSRWKQKTLKLALFSLLISRSTRALDLFSDLVKRRTETTK